MSKEKISSQEIVDLVAAKALVSKRAADEFLKVMILTIEEALLAGDVVKIKNFGTFKLHWNEPRKSVNVQTGEDIVLSGYYKVSFRPDSARHFESRIIFTSDSNIPDRISILNGTGEPPTSVNDNDVEHNIISISPNPARDYIEIKSSEGYDIQIFDILSEIVSTPSAKAATPQG